MCSRVTASRGWSAIRCDIPLEGTLFAISTGPRTVAPEGVYRRESTGTWTPLGPDPGGPFELRGAALRFSVLTPGLVLLTGSGHGSADYGAAI